MRPFATTQHLNLRAIAENDKEPFLALENDFRVKRTADPGYVAPNSEGYWKKLQEDFSKEMLVVVVEVKREYAHLRKWDADEEQKADGVKMKADWDRELFAGFGVLSMHMAKNRDASFGISLTPQWWGNGFATEVTEWIIQHGFEQLGLHRITLGVFSSNPAGQRVYEKCGFVHEGVTRKAFWVDGGWVDEIRMGMLEEEYWTRKHATRDS